MTGEVCARLNALRTILDLRENPTQDSVLSCLAIREAAPVLKIPATIERGQCPPKKELYAAGVRPPAWWEKLIGYRTRYERRMRSSEESFASDYAKWQQEGTTRISQVAMVEQQYHRDLAAHKNKLAERNREIEELKARYEAGDSDAVVAFFELVLDRSVWPDEFLQEYRIAYDSDSKQLVLDYKLPTVGVVPQIVEYRYVKTKDTVEERRRKPAEVKEIYRDVVAAVALRCLHECFSADSSRTVDVLVFSGFVDAIDPATGNAIRPYLISLRVTRERFETLVLDLVDTRACLRNLGAQVSPQPAELLPVKPVIEFDMIDKRFISETDVISELDSRPNLMDLTPAEFEGLVGNLFTRMGLETKLTRTHRDGGVDAIAWDTRPILGGKVVIQAKRYSNTVGVSAVRDLYGTMMNEGANKGILVTTSSYGPDAYDFCRDKPVELIDGSRLLYHLEEVGVKARIIFPTDQVPPV